MPFKIGKALIYAVLLWTIGFVWGSIVFMTPALKTVAAIPQQSGYQFPHSNHLAHRHLSSG